MKCFFCGSDQSAVLDKRTVKTTGEIRRRRECLKCHKRFTTYERVGVVDLYVLKRDGRKEVFDRNKIRLGLMTALEKRPALERLDELVDRIVKGLQLKGKNEVESRQIGKLALQALKKMDIVAYLRFASVHRQFEQPADFRKELRNLKL